MYDSDSIMMNAFLDDIYLEHHGVKGMHWGVWDDETAARYGQKAAKYDLKASKAREKVNKYSMKRHKTNDWSKVERYYKKEKKYSKMEDKYNKKAAEKRVDIAKYEADKAKENQKIEDVKTEAKNGSGRNGLSKSENEEVRRIIDQRKKSGKSTVVEDAILEGISEQAIYKEIEKGFSKNAKDVEKDFASSAKMYMQIMNGADGPYVNPDKVDMSRELQDMVLSMSNILSLNSKSESPSHYRDNLKEETAAIGEYADKALKRAKDDSEAEKIVSEISRSADGGAFDNPGILTYDSKNKKVLGYSQDGKFETPGDDDVAFNISKPKSNSVVKQFTWGDPIDYGEGAKNFAQTYKEEHPNSDKSDFELYQMYNDSVQHSMLDVFYDSYSTFMVV